MKIPLAAALPLSWAFALTVPIAAQGASEGDVSCRVCHPGAVRGLSQSLHATLLQIEAVRACTSCHGDLGAHVAAASNPGASSPAGAAARIVPVAAAACATCHPGRGLAPGLAAHPLHPAFGARAPGSVTPAQQHDQQVLDDLTRAAQRSDVRWSGLLDLGYRFVHVAGSRDGYATDVDLQPGVRARTVELRGSGTESSPVDELLFAAADLGDPRWSIGGRARKTGTGSIDIDFRRDRLRYYGAGDYHRVDRSARSGTADVEIELDRSVRAFASFAHRDEDGFWLTERIGNRNVSVQSFVTGVASPRTARSEDSELGITGKGDVWTWTAAVSYRDDRERDRWSFARPAQANPAFPEGEDFTSRSSLRGPGGRLQLDGRLDALSIDLGVRYFDHDRRVVGNGTAAGFDVAQFTTDTQALGDGHARTWLVDLSATLDLGPDLQLIADLHWRDHVEDLLLRQRDVSTFPTLSTTVTVDTVADQHTAQRLLDSELSLQWAALPRLDLGIGYGFTEEHLRVPDLVPLDARDFRRGTVRDRGVLGNARWRPLQNWTVRGDVRAFGQDGIVLHELAPERSEEQSGSIGYAGDEVHTTVFVRHRRNQNDVSQHDLDSRATGLTTGIDRRGFGADVAYTFARIDSATLTNFYFDPDPNPVPTLVGFRGDTNTVSGTLRVDPSAEVHWQFVAAYATTTGDFDVSTFDWRVDLRWQVAGPSSSAGTEYRQSYFKADGGIDDWSAQSLFVYWRQAF